MKIMYIDESGGFESPGSSPSATPLMVIAGVILDDASLPALTYEFLKLKATFYPAKVSGHPHLLDYVLAEVKGSDVRGGVRASGRNRRRQSIGFLDKVVGLLVAHDARIVARVWVKAPGRSLSPASSYSFAVQDLTAHFEHYLRSDGSSGLVVCDGRAHQQDAEVAHSVFTQKHKLSGDSYPNIVETVLFGRSENHVGLQLADMVASALIFPMATRTYCSMLPIGVHTHPRFDLIRQRFRQPVAAMRYRYRDATGRPRGGIVVSDKLGQRPSTALFR